MVLSVIAPESHKRRDDSVVEYVPSFFVPIVQFLGAVDPNVRFSIVAVHGLYEDHISAWRSTSSGVFWLKDLLPSYIPDARILTYGYVLDANSTLSAQSPERVLQHAQTLVAELEADRYENDASRRPLIFICHGLGGVVVKRALAYSASRVSKKVEHLYSIFVSTYGILFFGTPHDGSQSPWIHLAAPSSKMQAHTQSIMAKHSETLQNISDQFAPLIKQFHVHFFWEEKNTVTPTWTGRLVQESSAAPILNDTERSGIWATHSEMCKFTNAGSPGFPVVRATLKRYTRDCRDLIATRWEQAFKALERLRRNEASEILDTYDPSQNSPIIYEKHDRPLRNKYFCVPYNASSIFTGRRDIAERLEKNIFSGSPEKLWTMQKRFILYGLGGSGKTQFCLKFIQDHRQR